MIRELTKFQENHDAVVNRTERTHPVAVGASRDCLSREKEVDQPLATSPQTEIPTRKRNAAADLGQSIFGPYRAQWKMR